MKKILIASDHAGRKLKERVVRIIKSEKLNFEDLSPINTPSDDYPDYAKKLCKQLKKSKNTIGILACGSGIGMSIAANKIKGIRAAVIHSNKEAKLARNDNDANVLVFPGPYASTIFADSKLRQILNTFMTTKFAGKRHARRVNKLES